MVLTQLSLFLRLLGVPTTAYLLARSFGARLARVGGEELAIPLPRISLVLNHEMIGVVKETMQPAHVSLWLRPEKLPKGGQADQQSLIHRSA